MITTWACLFWANATFSVALHAWLRRRPLARRRIRERARLSVVFRPCAGDEPWLDESLRSSASADGAKLRFLVASSDDPAGPATQSAVADLVATGHDARVVVTRAHGPNKKADQLHRALSAESDGAVVLVADSDVRLSTELVDALVRTVTEDGVDAAWAPPIEVAPITSADRASARVLDGSLHAFALLSALDPSGMVGKTFAIRRCALDSVGGFGALVTVLGEDMELARRLRARGATVRAVSTPTASLARGRTHDEVVARYARWLGVIRAQRPWLLLSYPLLFGAAPLQLALAGAACALDGLGGVASIVAVLFARGATAVFARHRSGLPLFGWGAFGRDLFAADLVLLRAFTTATFRKTVRWRGVPLRIAADGTIAEVEP